MKSWVPNAGPSCTTAAVLAGLGALGVPNLPPLEEATQLLAGGRLQAPALLDYVGFPGRRAPLDVRVEALARSRDRSLASRTAPVLPGWPLQPRPGAALIVHLAWGQERPGHYGSWGWQALQPATYATGGHSVLLWKVDGPRWWVLDPNLEGIQDWPRPGIATARTLLLPPSPSR